MSVAVIKYDKTVAALREAINLCDGLSDLNPDNKVLVKPNLVIGGRRSQRPDGLVTTTAALEGIILILKELGCKDITIADSGVHNPNIKLNTQRAFDWSGTSLLAKRMEIPLINLNEDSHTKVDFDGLEVEVADTVLKSDFIINFPVLKTHQLTKISLGLKNLKGVLSDKSKKDFHRNDLERFISILGTKIPVNLTIIDGTYALQRGPVGEDVHRTDLVIAGKDMLEVDTVGTNIMGIEPGDVDHLKSYARKIGRSIDLENIEIIGEQIDDVKKPLDWVSNWPLELMEKYNISGLNMETPGYSNCSGCGMGVFVGINNFFRENPDTSFDGAEICVGREPVASPDAKKVVCLGICAYETNKEHPNAVEVKGCPPKVEDIYETLKGKLLS